MTDGDDQFRMASLWNICIFVRVPDAEISFVASFGDFKAGDHFGKRRKPKLLLVDRVLDHGVTRARILLQGDKGPLLFVVRRVRTLPYLETPSGNPAGQKSVE